jgi:hypothetical protein
MRGRKGETDMGRLLLTLPLTFAAAAVLSTAPIPMSSAVSEAKEITAAQKQGCARNDGVCTMIGCRGVDPRSGKPIKGAQGLSGDLLRQCDKDCSNKYNACMKTGSWPNRVIGRGGGTDVKTKPGGVATVPKTPGKHSSGTLPNRPGGGVASQPKSPPVGSIGIKQQTGPTFGTIGTFGIKQQHGPAPGGTILRSGGRR